MSDVTLVRVLRTTQETKYGVKPKLVIKTEQHGDKWLSSFKLGGTENWAEGDVVRINVQEKGDFLNFEPVVGGPSNSAGIGTTSTPGNSNYTTTPQSAHPQVAPSSTAQLMPEISMDGDVFGDTDEEIDGTGF